MAENFFEVMAEALNALAPGLKKFGPDVSKELKRLTTQGAMESAHALYNGTAFTLYGPGQYPPKTEIGKGVHGQVNTEMEPQPQAEQERGGREM